MLNGKDTLIHRVENCADLLRKEINALVKEKIPDRGPIPETAWKHIHAGWKIEIGGILAVHLFEILRLCEGFIVMEDIR